MRPLVSYYGGKQRLASKIVPLLPPHTVYVEPFCGGASVLFAKDKPAVTNNHHYREVINDTLGQLVTLYRVAQRHPDELLGLINETLYSRRDHKRAKEIYENPEGHDDLTVAWATYVNLMQSFNHQADAGWRTGVRSKNNPVTWEAQKSRVLSQIERLCGVHIEQRDALDVIRTWDSPQTCFYVDPPYPDAYQGHYGGYTQDDFQALIDTLQNCKGSFVLSCYSNEAVPTEWTQHDFTAYMSASPGKGRASVDTRRTECVWVVDRSHTMPDDLAKIATDYRPKSETPKEQPSLWG